MVGTIISYEEKATLTKIDIELNPNLNGKSFELKIYAGEVDGEVSERKNLLTKQIFLSKETLTELRQQILTIGA